MAVQKSKKSRSRRGMRRAHMNASFPSFALSKDQESNEIHLRHHMTPDGYYRGRLVVDLSKSLPESVDGEEES